MSGSQQTFSVKDQIGNASDFVSHTVLVKFNSAIFTKTGGRLDLVHEPQFALYSMNLRDSIALTCFISPERGWQKLGLWIMVLPSFLDD